MYKIGIIGHGPECYSNLNELGKLIDGHIDLLNNQYNGDVVFNVGGEIGPEQLAATSCINNNYKIHLYLSAPVDQVSTNWYNDQGEKLDMIFNNSYGTTIISPQLTIDSVKSRDKFIVDNSNFIIFYWIKKHQGRVYEAIKYALETNKLSLNGLNEFKMITKHE